MSKTQKKPSLPLNHMTPIYGRPKSEKNDSTKSETTKTVSAEIVESTNTISSKQGELQGTEEENARLKAMETKFINGISTVCEMGLALTTIRDEKLYKARGYKTFGAYVKKIFEISRVYAYRLIGFNRVRGLLGEPKNVKIPELLVRPLASIEGDEDVKILWAKAKGNDPIPSYEKLASVVTSFKKNQKAKKVKDKKATDSNETFDSPTLHKRINVSSVTDAVEYIIEAAEGRVSHLSALYNEFSPFFNFKTEAREKLIAAVKEWQKAELDDFSSKISG